MATITTIVTVNSRLDELEGIIREGMQSFLAVGAALLEIRNDHLYRDRSYSTFEDYCRQQWNISRAHAYRQIDAAEVAKKLSPMGDKPRSERQARELVGLSIAQVQEVAKQIPLATSTAAQVREVVQQVANPEPEKPTCTKCGSIKLEAAGTADAYCADCLAYVEPPAPMTKANILQSIRDHVETMAMIWPAGESKLQLYINLVVLADEIYPEGSKDAPRKESAEHYRCAAKFVELEPSRHPSDAPWPNPKVAQCRTWLESGALVQYRDGQNRIRAGRIAEVSPTTVIFHPSGRQKREQYIPPESVIGPAEAR